jgi:hypothetical protein
MVGIGYGIQLFDQIFHVPGLKDPAMPDVLISFFSRFCNQFMLTLWLSRHCLFASGCSDRLCSDLCFRSQGTIQILMNNT